MMPRPCIRCCSTLFKGRLRRSYFYGANKATTKIPPYLGPCSAPIASLAEPAEKYQPVTDLIVYIHKTERERSSESSYTPPLVPLPSKPVGDGQWFRWTQQRTRNGQSPYMKYIKKVEEVDKYVAKLVGPGLAMDMEWNVNGRCDVDLLQICSEDLILLVHLSEMGSFPESLKAVIEDPRRIKCGVNIKNDAGRLAEAWNIVPQGLLELGQLAQVVDSRWSQLKIKRSIISLQKLSNMYLSKPIWKGELSVETNWKRRTISGEGLFYAANDCYATWKIFQMLEALRRLTPGLEIPPRIDYRLELIRKMGITKIKERKETNWVNVLRLLKVLRIHVMDTVELLSKMTVDGIPSQSGRPYIAEEMQRMSVHIRKIQKH